MGACSPSGAVRYQEMQAHRNGTDIEPNNNTNIIYNHKDKLVLGTNLIIEAFQNKLHAQDAEIARLEQQVNELQSQTLKAENKKRTDDTKEQKMIITETDFVEIMNQHRTMLIDHPDHDIVQFIDKIGGMTAVLNAYHAYLDDDNVEKIYNQLTDKHNDGPCTKCESLRRNGRDKDECKKDDKYRGLYSKDNDVSDREIVYHQILDSIHVALYHAFDCGFRKFEEAKDMDCDNAKETPYDGNQTKFVSNVTADNQNHDTTDVRVDALMKYVLKLQSWHGSHFAPSFAQYLLDNAYDTDAIDFDIQQSEPNLKNAVHGNGIFSKIQLYLDSRSPDRMPYSFGYRFYYWEHFKNNQNKITVIRRDKNNSKYDHGNQGYRLCDWYVPPKYFGLKEEMIHNAEYSISLTQWKISSETANAKLQSDYGRSIAANRFWETVYEIKEHAKLLHHHVLAVGLYCNHTDLCTHICKTYRKSAPYETNESLIKRHQNYYFFGKYLREMVEVYGAYRTKDSCQLLYHGVSGKVYPANCYARIAGPMSTTTASGVAERFAGSCGIVLTLLNDTFLRFYLDCKKWSDYGHEDEVLFVGAYHPMPIINIYVPSMATDYKSLVTVLNTMTKMFSAHQSMQKIRLPCSKWTTFIEFASNGFKSEASGYDDFATNLIKAFCFNLKQIKISSYWMELEDEYKDENDHRHYGYRKIYELFYKNAWKIPDLPTLFGVFVYLQSIVLEEWLFCHLDQCATVNSLFTFVRDSLTKAPRSFNVLTIAFKTVFNENNTECRNSHELIQISDSGYWCDRCNDFLDEKQQIHVCEREENGNECDYAICELCYGTVNNSVLWIKDSINKYQQSFEKIGWKVEVIYHDSRLEAKKYDALCFYRLMR
eukprot:52396_1